MAEPHQYGDLTLVRRLIGQARPFWGHLAVLALVGLLATPLALLGPLPVKIAVDSVLGDLPPPWPMFGLTSGGSDTALLLVLCAVFVVALALVREAQSLVEWLLGAYTGERLQLRFRAELFGHVQRLSIAYHDRLGPTDSAYRIQYDASAIQHVLVNGVLPLAGTVLTLVGVFTVTYALDPELALIALTIAPVLVILSRAYGRPLRRRWVAVHALQSSALSVIAEVLGAVRVVKAFGQEDREQARFVTQSREAVRAQLRVIAVQGGFSLLVASVTALATAAVLLIGVQHVQQGRLSLGELFVVLAYLSQLIGPLQSLSTKTADLQGSLASAERAFRLLDEQPDVIERPHAQPIHRAIGSIVVRGLSFAYETRDVLRDVNLEVAPGTRVGISGETGAGKSTFVNLLCRFYDPTAGQILLDGVDLRDYRLADLRAQLSIVLQEPVLFPTTIAENIAYARPDAAPADIEAAARAANAHDFIVAQPEGYDTRVGERGLRLSGGERQRISIARAFLRDAPILILDEPTSSVDTETEGAIMEAMWRLMAGRTTFMIAHRLSTLAACDRRLRVVDGTIVEWVPQSEDEARQATGDDGEVGWSRIARRGVASTRRQRLTRMFGRRSGRTSS